MLMIRIVMLFCNITIFTTLMIFCNCQIVPSFVDLVTRNIRLLLDLT